ncbi:MAG: hypothetical protein V1856_00290 [Candidatus Liptonbacteria bacterium]
MTALLVGVFGYALFLLFILLFFRGASEYSEGIGGDREERVKPPLWLRAGYAVGFWLVRQSAALREHLCFVVYRIWVRPLQRLHRSRRPVVGRIK